MLPSTTVKRKSGPAAADQQWIARAWRIAPMNPPTAHALVAELAATASRALLEPGLGLGTCTRLVPFHLRIRVFSVFSAWPIAALPTGHPDVAGREHGRAEERVLRCPWVQRLHA
jgi:hypothetical protein